jgi:hypothetical protein
MVGIVAEAGTAQHRLGAGLEWDRRWVKIVGSKQIEDRTAVHERIVPAERRTQLECKSLREMMDQRRVGHPQHDLYQAAHSLNTGPRQTLEWMTPSDKLAEAPHCPPESTAEMGGWVRHGRPSSEASASDSMEASSMSAGDVEVDRQDVRCARR